MSRSRFQDEDQTTQCVSRLKGSSDDGRNTINYLRRVVNTINTFTDGERCIQFLESLLNEKVSMIIFGSLGKEIVPCVHHMSQVDSIFIFCGNIRNHEQWFKDFSKNKGVYTEIKSICKSLIMYTQIMKEILLTIAFEQQHMDEFIEYCREVFAENESELKNVDQFAQKYRQHTPIWWYNTNAFYILCSIVLFG